MIHRSRGSPALLEFFTEEFDGTLISDFWAAYNAVACAARQMCFAHLFRELEHTEQYNISRLASTGRCLPKSFGDAIRLWRRRDELSAESYASRRARLTVRLQDLINTDCDDKNARRLIKRLRRYKNDLFTFLDQPLVPFDNNHAEREIRPAVIIRKNSYGNRSEHGADCQAVLMSIFRTLKRRGHDPIRTVIAALKQHILTGKLPPLPPKTTSDG